jgi:hypothetical protein
LTLGLAAARRFSLVGALLLLLTIAPVTPAVTGQSASPYTTLGHGWLSVNTNLRSASHISAWSIDQYLARNTALRGLGHAFKSAETKYDVNALYLLAHAMHETAFGTSYIAQRYRNLFGWNAFDRDPTGLATRFPTYAAGIDYVAAQISLQYLSPTGKFYGGAATLRGMHHYASDPQWAMLIARIANGIVLPTLATRDIAFREPEVGDASTGKPVVVTIATDQGTLPDGLEAAYRWVPVAVVEAGTPSGTVPPADPDFRPAKGAATDDQLRVTVTAPARPGRYRLELQLRDSDGTELTEYDVPEIPDAAVRVYGADAVSYAITATDTGLAITVTNEGTRTIPATVAVAGGASGAVPTTVPTILSAWLVGPDGTPGLIARAPLTANLKPGASWTADVAAPDAALLPGVLVVRVEVGGPGPRLGGSPPGVFRLAADGSAVRPDPSASADPSGSSDPTASALPSASVDPSATAAPSTPPDPFPSGSPVTPSPASPAPSAAPSTIPAAHAGAPVAATGTASPAATATDAEAAGDDPGADPTGLTVGELTPIDALTRVLLNPDWKPAPPPKPTGAKAAAAGTTKPGVVRLSYQPLISLLAPGTATIRVTNGGTAPLLTSLPIDLLAPAPSATPATETDAAAAEDPTALLQVTAIPAWGPATEPIVLSVPLLIDVEPGRSVDVGIALPAATAGQSSYLVVARTVGADGRVYPATLFWLRGAAPGAATQAPVTTPTLATTARASSAKTPATPSRSPVPTPTPSPTPAAPSGGSTEQAPVTAAAPTPSLPAIPVTPTPVPAPAVPPGPDRTPPAASTSHSPAPTANLVPTNLLSAISVPPPARPGPR